VISPKRHLKLPEWNDYFLLRKAGDSWWISLAFYLLRYGITACCFASLIKWESLEITLFSSISMIDPHQTKLFSTAKEEPIISESKFTVKFFSRRSQGQRETAQIFFLHFAKKSLKTPEGNKMKTTKTKLIPRGTQWEGSLRVQIKYTMEEIFYV